MKLNDIYKDVTDRIVSLLKQGVNPWQSSYWLDVGFPTNFKTKNCYKGMNLLLLSMLRYRSPYFLTYKQAQDLGGQVKKGEKGVRVFKFGTIGEGKDKEQTDDDRPNRIYIKAYTVFNACQIDGIEFPKEKPPFIQNADQTVEEAEAIINTFPSAPVISEGRKTVACYNPTSDRVDIPQREYFPSINSYYSTLFHELIHSTGHKKRLNRKTLISSGSKTNYSKEELVAEMGAAFLSAKSGIINDQLEESAAYIGGWLKVLSKKENLNWVYQAANQSQKAVEHILNQR